MKYAKWRLPAMLSAALLAACGGDDKVQFNSVVSFGDSYSDAGA